MITPKTIEWTKSATKILNLVDMSGGWGPACNQIQDAAYKVLSVKDWNDVSSRVGEDLEISEGNDFITMNGRYFDWKEFDHRKVDIVYAYLLYYSPEQLVKIHSYLRTEQECAELRNKIKKGDK